MSELMPVAFNPLQRPHQPILSEALLAEARSNTFGDHLPEGEPDPSEEVLARVGDWMTLPDTLPGVGLVSRRL